MKSKSLLIILCVSLLVFALVGCGSKEISITNNVTSIDIDRSGDSVTIYNHAKITDIVDKIKGSIASGKKKSNNDTPTNIKNYIVMRLSGDTATTLYLYKKNDKCYIEMPYEGIWRVDDSIYNYIDNIINDIVVA